MRYMQTINERIAFLVKELHMTRIAFGKRIGITSGAMTQLCNGKANPSNQTIALICREFRVNEEWLRSGIGEMFQPEPVDDLERMVEERGLSPEYALVVKQLLMLPPDMQDAVVKMVIGVANAIQDQQAAVEQGEESSIDSSSEKMLK